MPVCFHMVNKQGSSLEEHLFVMVSFVFFRPYFSYFITFVQVVIMIAAVAVYGFAKPHYNKFTEEALVRHR